MERELIHVVYIDDFWHAKLLRNKSSVLSSDTIELESDKILRNLRLYSLFFQTIYISRLHLIHFVDENQVSIVRKVVNDKFFQELVERGVICLSIRSGIDGKADNERLIERSAKAGNLNLDSISDALIPTLEKADTHLINSDLWGDSTESRVQNLLKIHSDSSIVKHFGADVRKKILDKSLDRNGKFLFERFFLAVNELVKDENLARHILRQASDSYLELPAGQGWDFITIDSAPRRLGLKKFDTSTGLERWLFSPEILQIFLQSFWSKTEIDNFCRCSINVLEEMRGDRSSNYIGVTRINWTKFRYGYQRIAWQLSESVAIQNRLAQHESSPGDLNYEVLFEEIGRIRLFGDVDKVIDAAVAAAATTDPTAGGIAQITRASTQTWFKAQLRLIQWSLRHPDIFWFLNRARNLTANIS